MENRKYMNTQKKLALATIEVARCRIADKQKIGGCGTTYRMQLVLLSDGSNMFFGKMNL